jgi:hypothetical protein
VIFFEKDTTPKVFSDARIGNNSNRLGHGEPGTDIHGSDRALDSDSPVRLYVVGSGGAVGKPKVSRVYTWTCQFCGMEFDTEIYSQRYCNRTHKELAYRLRKEERLKNAPAREIQLTLIPSTETPKTVSKPVHDP